MYDVAFQLHYEQRQGYLYLVLGTDCFRRKHPFGCIYCDAELTQMDIGVIDRHDHLASRVKEDVCCGISAPVRTTATVLALGSGRFRVPWHYVGRFV